MISGGDLVLLWRSRQEGHTASAEKVPDTQPLVRGLERDVACQ